MPLKVSNACGIGVPRITMEDNSRKPIIVERIDEDPDIDYEYYGDIVTVSEDTILKDIDTGEDIISSLIDIVGYELT